MCPSRSTHNTPHGIPFDFLEDEDLVHQVSSQLETLEGSAEHKWDSAYAVVRSMATQYAKEHKLVEESQVLPLLLNSTVHHVTAQGWKYLAEMGFKPTTHAQAYSQFMALHERDHSDKVGNLLLSKLKGPLAGEPNCPTSQKDRTCQINS